MKNRKSQQMSRRYKDKKPNRNLELSNAMCWSAWVAIAKYHLSDNKSLGDLTKIYFLSSGG